MQKKPLLFHFILKIWELDSVRWLLPKKRCLVNELGGL